MKKQLVNKRRFSSLQAIVHFHGPSTNSEHTSEQVLAKQIAGTLPTLYHTIDNTSTPSYKWDRKQEVLVIDGWWFRLLLPKPIEHSVRKHMWHGLPSGFPNALLARGGLCLGVANGVARGVTRGVASGVADGVGRGVILGVVAGVVTLLHDRDEAPDGNTHVARRWSDRCLFCEGCTVKCEHIRWK